MLPFLSPRLRTPPHPTHQLLSAYALLLLRRVLCFLPPRVKKDSPEVMVDLLFSSRHQTRPPLPQSQPTPRAAHNVPSHQLAPRVPRPAPPRPGVWCGILGNVIILEVGSTDPGKHQRCLSPLLVVEGERSLNMVKSIAEKSEEED